MADAGGDGGYVARARGFVDAQVDKFKRLDQKQQSDILLKVAALLFAAFFVVLIALVATVTSVAAGSAAPVVVFTDGDPEDYAALYYLLKRSDMSVPLVVLTGGGWSKSLAAAWLNLRRFLAMVAAEGNPRAAAVTVAYGSSFTTAGGGGSQCTYSRVVPRALRVQTDNLFGLAPSLARCAPAAAWRRTDAATGQPETAPPFYEAPLLAALFAGRSLGGTTLLVLGPLTDVAAFFNGTAAAATRVPLVRAVVAEGGAFGLRSRGNVPFLFPTSAQAELNVFFDPPAASRVLQMGFAAVYLVTQDAVATAGTPALWSSLVSGDRAEQPLPARGACELPGAPRGSLSARQALAAMLQAFQQRRGAQLPQWLYLAPLVAAAFAADPATARTAQVTPSFLWAEPAPNASVLLATTGKLWKQPTPTAAAPATLAPTRIVLKFAPPTAVGSGILRVFSVRNPKA